MDRRRFFKTASASCVAGAAIPAASRVVAESVAARSEGTEIRKPLTSYTAEDHRRRLENISICEHGIDTHLKKHLITSYLPGQAYYNLGEYPARKPWWPRRSPTASCTWSWPTTTTRRRK